MSKYWCGKRAVVVGGSTGLGRALAGVLTEFGARVAIVARGRAALDAAAEQLRARGGDVLALAADITNPIDVDRMTADIVKQWGGVDFVCHSAGRSTRGEVMATSPDKFRELWEVNFLSAVRVFQGFAPALVASHGHMVLIGSLASKFAPRYLGAYPSSKFALAALAQQVRLELADKGMHVLLVCPGPIAREDTSARYADESAGVPVNAHRPGGGAKVSSIDPQALSEKILRACERRDLELIVPAKARLLVILSQISPRIGDWLLGRMTSR